MRSRYAAFARGLGEYLVDTLATDHPDRGVPRADLVRELARAKERQRFLGLCVMHASEREVLFYARIFERGKDASFAELSDFVVEAGELRYASGVLVPTARLPEDPTVLTLDRFLDLASD